MNDWLDQLIATEATILTANQRLAASLTAAVNERHKELGRQAWRPLEIREWRAYLTSRFQADSGTQALPLRLSARQSLVLWEDALRPDLEPGQESLPALARLARETRDALADHRVEVDIVAATAASDDQRVFSESLRRYLARLDNNEWIDDAGIRGYVLANVDAYDWPGHLSFAGFLELPPIASALQSALETRGSVFWHEPRSPRAELSQLAFGDRYSELRAAGGWARDQREQGKRVAIVVGGLDAAASEIGALVREGFTPGWQLDRQAAGSVNVSFGRRLMDYPMIAIAIAALKSALSARNSSELSVLLRSPILGIHTDNSRIQASLDLHTVPDRDWTPALLRAWQSPDARSSLADLMDRLEAIAVEWQGSKQTAKHWAANVEAALDSLGWPGTTPLDSDEFQLLNRWRELLEEFSSLTTVTGRLTGLQAVARLASLASDTVFQPEQLNSAVDVLGPMEAAGQSFDALWIAGLTDDEWPGPARPSALISLRLQRDAGMRDSSPGLRLEQQSALLERLVTAAPSAVLSYPLAEGETEKAPSPLLTALAAHDADCPDPGWFVSEMIEHDALTTIAEIAPPVRPGERVFGGARIPELQHGCPFDAFAAGRLALNEPEPFSRAIGARIRGILTHDALCRLYADIPDQQSLSELDGSQLQQRIHQAIEHESRAWFVGVDGTLRRMMQLEEKRLQGVLRDVVELDRCREVFSVVAREESTSLQHGPISLGFRIDRIDRLPDGEILILDYKTGKAQGFVRQDGAPRSFQLVVYSMSVEETVAGLGLYFAAARETAIRGIGRGLGREREFSNRLAAWRGEVRGLLDSFVAGDLRIVAQRPLADGMDTLLLTRLSELKRYA